VAVVDATGCCVRCDAVPAVGITQKRTVAERKKQEEIKEMAKCWFANVCHV
jgi:hypothetical protein